MRSSEYWRRRAELLTQQIENGEKVPMQRVIRLYKAAFDEIDADIRKIQSTSDAVNKAELAALKRELAEAAAAAPDTARMRAIQNSISAYKFRIDRAELVKQRAYAHLMKAAGRAAAIIKPLLKDTYKAARYGTIDDIASGLDCGVDFSLVPERTINKIIEAPFHGKNYSQRVWDNTAETAGKAQKILTQGMVKGESYSKMARSLSKLCNNTFYNSFRLISTEAAHFTEEGRFDAYNDLGIDKYTYYATLGSKTCDVCGALDGRTFDTSAAREGKNKPPIHPHCRCYTVVGDVKLKSRLARDPVSGKNYKVRGDMTYNEWTDSLSNEQRMAIKAYRNRHGDMKQYRKYIDRLGKGNMPKTFDLFQKMKYNETEKWDEIKGFYRYKGNNPIAELNDYRCAHKLMEMGIKGNVHIPCRKIDEKSLLFDDVHINKMRKHNVSEQEAKKYISEAVMSITKRNGLTENYYHKDGLVYVNPSENMIKTAFKKDEFSDNVLKIMEVLSEYGY